MKILYTRFSTALATVVLIISLNVPVKAQPAAPGDIVFTGWQTSGFSLTTDQFVFVPLVAMPVGTVIKFTDNAWNSVSQTFNNTEANYVFTVTPTAIPAGREIRIIIGPPAVALFGNGASAGTVAATGAFSLPTTGEQMFAYLGPDLAPTVFLAGIHMNVETGGCGVTTAAGWDPATCVFPTSPTNNTSMKPAALTTGVNAFWPTVEHDNGRFNGCGLTLTTPAQVRAAVNNPANWFFEDPAGSEASWSPNGPFAYCAFVGLAPLPVNLVSFTGKLNSDKTITLQWKVEAQVNIREYIIEESSTGADFGRLNSISALSGNARNYSFIDMQPANGNNYYRLKIIDFDGTVSYSDVIVVNNKAGINLMLYPNPVTDKLTIQQFGTLRNKTAVLTNAQGKILQQLKLSSLQQEVNMKAYPAGIYILKMADGTVFQVVK